MLPLGLDYHIIVFLIVLGFPQRIIIIVSNHLIGSVSKMEVQGKVEKVFSRSDVLLYDIVE